MWNISTCGGCLGFYAVNHECKYIYLKTPIIHFSNSKINFTSTLKARDLARELNKNNNNNHNNKPPPQKKPKQKKLQKNTQNPNNINQKFKQTKNPT